MKGKGGAMKTVKEVSELTGISIRTLRYYDEIDLLKPAKVTEAGYRLYDEKTLKKLRQIMFFRELEVPLSEIKVIMKDSESDNRKILETQKMMLEMKRNHLNGIIELISDVLKGEDKMSFEAFNDKDIQKITQHSLEIMSEEDLKHIHERMISEVKNYGGRIDRIYYCTALTDSDINRKPGIGMFLQILRDYPDIDKAKCLMIGDSDSDIKFAKNCGIVGIKVI